jgi:hypothetical protein
MGKYKIPDVEISNLQNRPGKVIDFSGTPVNIGFLEA